MKKILDIIKNGLSKALSILVDCIVPTLPIMIGVGMIKVVLILIGPLVLNIISETSDTYVVLSFVANAGYYFMPIYVAVSSAEVFKTNKYVAALSGAMLIAPEFIKIVEANQTISIFSLPIALTNYGNQVIPSIIIVCVLSYIYNFLDNKLNNNIKPILVPLISIILITPISLCLIGPLGVFMGNYLVKFILFLKDLGPIGNAIMCAIIPYVTIFGSGGANLSAMLLLASSGCDPILFFSNVIYNNVLGFVVLAIYLKDKKPETLAAAITSAVAGTSEPALFSIAIKKPTAILSLTIGDFFAGFYAGIMGVKSYAMASFGTFGIITTIGPESSILHAAIAMIIGCIIGFVLSFLTYKKDTQ